jgi:hypothetical protein
MSKNRRCRIGLDLDNTIINYGDLFYRVARQEEWIPTECQRDKISVRGYLQSRDRNDLWTELQGLVYGPYLKKAEPYPDVDDFLAECCNQSIPVWIISHKTRFPAKGAQHDLHASASAWLKSSGLVQNGIGGIRNDRVMFCETRSEKIAAIAHTRLTHFVDDLPEVFKDREFPEDVSKYLYAPGGADGPSSDFETVSSWKYLKQIILNAG